VPVEYIAHPITANIRNETGARAINVLYTNNTLRPIQVVITMTHRVTVQNSFCLSQLTIGLLATAWGGWYNTPAVGIELYSCITGNIAPGATYRLTQNAAGGVNTILRWIEVDQ